MAIHRLERIQRQILAIVADAYAQVYLVGGTAISLLYQHRISEDLDFFTQAYSAKIHREIAEHIRKKTGYRFALVEEEKRKQYLPMAVYEFRVPQAVILKVDFVSDYAKLLKPRQKNGIASIDDIYYRKILAVVGWKAGESPTGRRLAGGRQKAKDLYDIFFLSREVRNLSAWFPHYFDLAAYERLTAWYLGIPKSRTVLELLELAPTCDTRLLFKHLDDEIIGKLNKRYFDS